jgi:hypothetical protein
LKIQAYGAIFRQKFRIPKNAIIFLLKPDKKTKKSDYCNKSRIFGDFFASRKAANQNNCKIGTRIIGTNIAGVILAVLTFVAPMKLVPIRTMISDPVTER